MKIEIGETMYKVKETKHMNNVFCMVPTYFGTEFPSIKKKLKKNWKVVVKVQ